MKYNNAMMDVMINKRGMTEKAAEREFEEIMDGFYDCLDNGDYEGCEEVLREYGFEMDYVFCLV